MRRADNENFPTHLRNCVSKDTLFPQVLNFAYTEDFLLARAIRVEFPYWIEPGGASAAINHTSSSINVIDFRCTTCSISEKVGTDCVSSTGFLNVRRATTADGLRSAALSGGKKSDLVSTESLDML